MQLFMFSYRFTFLNKKYLYDLPIKPCNLIMSRNKTIVYQVFLQPVYFCFFRRVSIFTYKTQRLIYLFCLFTICFTVSENHAKTIINQKTSIIRFMLGIKLLIILATSGASSASIRIPTLMCLFIGSPTHLSKHH